MEVEKRDNFGMRKYFFITLMMLWTTLVLGAPATSLRLHPDNELVVTGSTTTSFTVGSAEASGDATSESAPAIVYVPMAGPLGTVAYFTERGVTHLFTATDASYTVNFPFYINTTNSDHFLYVAVKHPVDGYKIVGNFPTNLINKTNHNETFPVSPKLMCDIYADCPFATTTGKEKFLAYFFLSTTLPTNLPKNSPGTPASYPGGIYFEINMSNVVLTNTELIPSITKIRVGDKRVVIEYTASAGMNEAKAVRVYNHGGTASAVAPLSPIQSYYASAGGLTSTEYPYNATSEVTVTGLENSVTNYFSVLFVDKYKFGTVLSDDLEGTPLEIQELLKKQSCFLLSAGFGEEHFIIDYFRHFRDTVLSHSFLGRKFISVYYEHAPKYALMIYENEAVRTVIRGAAYVLYFIFNYFVFILITSMTLLTAIYLYKNKEKIKI